jgi:hypothetical protein
MGDVTPLTNYAHFVELTAQFDAEHSTTTYIAKMNLSTINELFFQRNPWFSIECLVNDVFCTSNIVYSDDTEILRDYRSKLYAFYHIVKDIQNGIGLIHPINLHYFGKKVGMHPGNTRLHFMHQYHNELDVIITDYPDTIKTDHPQCVFESVDKHAFELPGLAFLTNVATLAGGPRSIYNTAGGSVPYKECNHSTTAGIWGLSGNTAPVLQYEYNNNVVYVNGEKILYRQCDKWWFDI